jgi:hypothetical protein
VGASGSYTVTAKLCVPTGAPLHCRMGDWFWPEQPKPSNSKCGGTVPPLGMSGLERVNTVIVQLLG